MAVQEGTTSVRVSWSSPSPLGDTTGYRISYSGGSSGNEVVSGGSTSTRTLTGLVNGASYTISIVGTSQHYFSDAIQVMNIGLGKYKGNIYSVFPYTMCVCFCSTSSRPAECHCGLHDSHLHLPLLECSQWLSGDQLCGDMAERYLSVSW